MATSVTACRLPWASGDLGVPGSDAHLLPRRGRQPRRRPAAHRRDRRAVAGGQTGFAAAHPLPPGMREPMLVTCTDGVGTKLLLAQELGRIEGLGQDLVAMCVNDLACTGARAARVPRLPGRRAPRPRRGGGPGALDRRRVRRRRLRARRRGDGRDARALRARPLRPGRLRLRGGGALRDARRAPRAGGRRDRRDPLVGHPLERLLAGAGPRRRRRARPDPDLLLAPTRLYVREVAAIAAAGVEVRAAAHITGGGIPENLPRALPEGLGAALDRRVVGAGPGDRRRPRDRAGGRGRGVAHVQHGPRHVRGGGGAATRRRGRASPTRAGVGAWPGRPGVRRG